MRAHEVAERIIGAPSTVLDFEVHIVVQSQGSIGGTPCVAIKNAQAGFDWDNGKFLIYPEQALTTLTPGDVAAIRESVRKGGSWHAYQSWKKQHDRVKELEAEVAELRAKEAA